MKTFLSVPSLFLVAGALAGMLVTGASMGEAPPAAAAQRLDREAVLHALGSEAGNNDVCMDRDRQTALGLRTETLVQIRLESRIRAYGEVLSPFPLADAVATLRVAEAAAQASSAAYERARLLHDDGQNVSTQVLEASAAAAASDSARLERARRQLLGQWGNGMAERSDLDDFTESLVSGSALLARIDLSPDHANLAVAKDAMVTTPGTPGQDVLAQFLGRAPDVDPARQGPGYFFLIDGPPVTMAPGALVVAYLHTAGPSQTGVLIPRSTVVHALGGTWVYLRRDADTFARVRVDLTDSPAAEWIAVHGPKAGDRVVTVGALELWAEEFKAQARGPDEED